MSFDTVRWHFYIGYLILGLMAFRIFWGFAGPAPVRFTYLIPTPSALMRNLKSFSQREPGGTPGHNPLGSISVLAMLVIFIAQGFTGLFIETEDFFEYGPLNGYVSEDTAKSMLGWHHFFAKLVLALVILHIAAILYYLLWKKENLIKPMINGWKWVRRK